MIITTPTAVNYFALVLTPNYFDEAVFLEQSPKYTTLGDFNADNEGTFHNTLLISVVSVNVSFFDVLLRPPKNLYHMYLI